MVTKEKKAYYFQLSCRTMVLNLPTLFFCVCEKNAQSVERRGLCVPIFFDGSLGFGGENRGILE